MAKDKKKQIKSRSRAGTALDVAGQSAQFAQNLMRARDAQRQAQAQIDLSPSGPVLDSMAPGIAGPDMSNPTFGFEPWNNPVPPNIDLMPSQLPANMPEQLPTRLPGRNPRAQFPGMGMNKPAINKPTQPRPGISLNRPPGNRPTQLPAQGPQGLAKKPMMTPRNRAGMM